MIAHVLLFFTPILTDVTPANTIFLGEHLPPISATRTRCNSSTGFCMSVSLTEFLQLKDIAQNSPSLCEVAVNEAADACKNQAAELAEVVIGREQKDAEVIAAYQVENSRIDALLKRSNTSRDKWRIGAYTAGAFAVVTTSILIIQGL
tara:strand:+ start:779 stop:1222 length:444 start_codon:yes stop_codon:yes gene_type:complete